MPVTDSDQGRGEKRGKIKDREIKKIGHFSKVIYIRGQFHQSISQNEIYHGKLCLQHMLCNSEIWFILGQRWEIEKEDSPGLDSCLIYKHIGYYALNLTLNCLLWLLSKDFKALFFILPSENFCVMLEMLPAIYLHQPSNGSFILFF